MGGASALFLVTGLCVLPAVADDWPQWRGPNRDGVWRETGIIKSFTKEQLDIVWRAEIGRGYSGPTVADGRVYVMDRKSGPNRVDRVLCFDAKTGKEVWTHSYECTYGNVSYPNGPRASVTIEDGRAYALGTMGHLQCFDAAKGKVLWQKDLGAEYAMRIPIWGVSASPLVDGELVVIQVGDGNNACLVAFDKRTGVERWRALNDRPSYAAPIVIEQARKRVLVCYTGDNVVGLDPQSGDVYWKYPFPPTTEIVQAIATPVLSRNMLFMTNFFDGSLLLRLRQDTPSVEKVWKRVGPSERQTDGLQSMISTPVLSGEYIYGVDSHGELRCLDLMTGDRIWESDAAVRHSRWANIHFVENGDKVWMFNEHGELIISRLSPEGFEEISRAKLIEPTRDQCPSRRGGVNWSHPAFAYKHVFARNGRELVCANLAKR
jgi:outer membrane protein assembly factor BamB